MSMMITRRRICLASFTALPWLFAASTRANSRRAIVETQLKALEIRSGGRLGVAVLNTATGEVVGRRLDERFALCSTFKTLAIAFTLARVDRGEEKLDRRVYFSEKDLVTPFKATRPHIADGMTVQQLCEAAAIVSDSTAANLLLAGFGGPSALTTYLRSIGDQTTRVDRTELALNIVKPGEVHDTTSPRAMVATLRHILLGSALSPASRARLTEWMTASRDAAALRLRRGLPTGWLIANKPGTWEGIATNDVGVIFPPGRRPIVVAAYLSIAHGAVADQEAVLADVARIVTGSA
ncbi:class A beta-lactamase [Sphingomonas sp. MMSM20]|uniref:class A beta-lactamase n=1 Tax=Sphingomonas lycopersici TaxID=2951807 RepID=UPI0022377475|nr:class A beta-lactamase [Sphingomonas lycopersici]MCW6530254.1 class A beta-lactamase [Sphingomonas lycopersici]